MRTMAKVPLIILSFVLSLILWIYVQVQENPPKVAKPSYVLDVIPLRLPDSLVASKPEQIRIIPRGPQDELARIDENKLKATVDLSKAEPSRTPQSFPVRIEMGDDYGVRWEPSVPQVQITVQRKTTKVVRVVVQESGELLNRDYLFLPKSTYTDPMAIKITGPESDVDNVKEARAILDLSRAAPGGSYASSSVYLVQKEDRPAAETIEFDPKVVIRPAIVVGAQVRSLHVQPVIKGAPAPGYVVKSIEIVPADVQVRGRPEALTAMSFLRTEKEIDLTNRKESANLTLVPDTGRDDVLVSPAVTVTVKVVIEPVSPPATKPPAPTGKVGRKRPGR